MLTKDEINQQVIELSKEQPWNHLYDFEGVKTRDAIDSPGCNIKKWERLEPILKSIDLDGKNVLDAGCSDGYFSLESARLGGRVLGIDPDALRLKKARFAKNFLAIDHVAFSPMGIYDKGLAGRHFDISLALGFLHRIPEMYKALEVLTDVSDTVVLEFKTLEGKDPICKWAGGSSKSNKLNTLYFLPTVTFVEDILGSFGFKTTYIDKDNSHLKHKRTIVVASR